MFTLSAYSERQRAIKSSYLLLVLNAFLKMRSKSLFNCVWQVPPAVDIGNTSLKV